jgi:hypothetical protein
MAPPFILRFQEMCAEIDGSQFASGTQTQTFTRTEQADPDVEHSSYRVLKHQDANAGTMTKTAVRAEHSDEDRAFSSFCLMPVEPASLSGTQTHTRMRAEEADEDRGGQHSRIIPSCSSS